MVFSFFDESFNQQFEEITRIAETYIKNSVNSHLRILSEEHLKLKDFVINDLKLEFDNYITYSKKSFNYITILKEDKSENIDESKIILSSSLIYLYLTEYEFRKGDDVSLEVQVDINTFKINVKKTLNHIGIEPYFITFADTQLAFKILQEIFHSPEYQGLNLIKSNLDKIKKYQDDWEKSFEDKKFTILEMEKRLEDSKKTYDFILLNKGFNKLYDQKTTDLKHPKNNLKWLFILILIVPIIELVFFGLLLVFNETINPTTVWYVLIPSISLIIFLFYFYRINLQDKRSIQSQMMQLELRMALCQFIHNYADDSEKLHAKNKAGRIQT